MPQTEPLYSTWDTVPTPNNAAGKVSFPTSCAANVQSQLEKGVALLHSFQYRQAESTFTDISQQEPHCAIAYWGTAMSLYEQLWGWPDAKSLPPGARTSTSRNSKPRPPPASVRTSMP
jgi:hypothetical protein